MLSHWPRRPASNSSMLQVLCYPLPEHSPCLLPASKCLNMVLLCCCPAFHCRRLLVWAMAAWLLLRVLVCRTGWSGRTSRTFWPRNGRRSWCRCVGAVNLQGAGVNMTHALVFSNISWFDCMHTDCSVAGSATCVCAALMSCRQIAVNRASGAADTAAAGALRHPGLAVLCAAYQWPCQLLFFGSATYRCPWTRSAQRSASWRSVHANERRPSRRAR